MATSELEILVKIRNDAERGIKELQGQVSGVGKEFLNTKSAIEMAGAALAGFAGYKMIGSFISATREANKQMAMAEYYARVYAERTGKDLMPQIIETGKQMQKLGGISDELGSVAYARLIAKFGEGERTLKTLIGLMKIGKLTQWDLDTSTTMLMQSTDDMGRALMFMARTLLIDVNPEMDDWKEILEKIIAASEKMDLSKLGIQIDIFKEKFSDIKEKTGIPFLEAVNWILGGATALIDRFPILADIIGGAMATIALVLGGAGLIFAGQKLLGILTAIYAMIGPWGMAIGAVLGGLVLWLQWVKKSWEDNKETVLIVAGAIVAVLTALLLFIGGPIWAIAGIIGLIGIAAIAVKENWETVKKALTNIWNDLASICLVIWSALKDWFEKNIISWFNEKVNWIQEQVNRIKSWVSEAWASVKNLPATIGGAAGGILGSKQLGGYISETGPYLLHRGEYVMPSNLTGAGIGGFTVNIYGNTFMSDEEMAVKIGDMIIKVLQRNVKF